MCDSSIHLNLVQHGFEHYYISIIQTDSFILKHLFVRIKQLLVSLKHEILLTSNLLIQPIDAFEYSRFYSSMPNSV